MRHEMGNTSAGSACAAAQAEDAASALKNAGAYLKELRRARKLTQSDLAEAVAVGRGTIERLEGGDDRVGIGTVFRILKTLGASPWYYYDLAIHPRRTLKEIHHERAVARGIETYMRVLAERKHISPTVLEETTHISFPAYSNGPADIDVSSAFALLLGLIYLDPPLTDLAPIVRASSEHEAIARELAEARGTFGNEMSQIHPHEQSERHNLPNFDTIVSRVSTILRYSQDLPTVLKHELLRVEADLKHYRALLVLAVSYIKAEP
jgi:transcriptional regulator with XRE-family HTH domain